MAGRDALERFSPLGSQFGTMLFKARIQLFKEDYSGLFLLKDIPADSSTRILFLSELGINLMDLEYRNDEFRVVSIEEFLDRRSIIKTLQNDFRALLLDLRAIDDFTVIKEEKDATEILQFRHRSDRYAYYYNREKGAFRITRKAGLFHRLDVSLTHGGSMGIGMTHKGIRLSIGLQQLEKIDEHGGR